MTESEQKLNVLLRIRNVRVKKQMAALQASEALKILAGFGTPMFSTLQLYDARNGEFTRMKIRKDPSCAVCGGSH
mgnify:CR=1 FL=1